MEICVCVHQIASVMFNSATLWTETGQAPLTMGFSRPRILEWVAMLPPGDLPDPVTEPVSVTSPAPTGGFFTTSTTWEAPSEI